MQRFEKKEESEKYKKRGKINAIEEEYTDLPSKNEYLNTVLSIRSKRKPLFLLIYTGTKNLSEHSSTRADVSIVNIKHLPAEVKITRSYV